MSPRSVQIILGVGLVVAAFATDTHAKRIPAILRPGPVIFLSALVCSLSVSLVTGKDYVGSYLPMWICQAGGFVVASAVWGKLDRPVAAAQHLNDPEKLRRAAILIWWVAAACAAYFFKTKGFPLLSGSVEGGRVSAAATGTGYVRLIAYMAGPASAMLFAVRHKRRWVYFVATVGITALFANRMPLIYLVAPLVAIGAIASQRIKNRHLLIAGAIGLVAVAILGTYRVTSEPTFRSYQEYQADLATGNDIGIAQTVVTHYAEVVPANAVLVKHLVDQGAIGTKFGSTYLTLFISALPGTQLSPDLLIKAASGKTFIGGGTPPTLMGEGYINFGYPGIMLGAFLTMGLARRWAAIAIQACDETQRRINAAIYGYVITWCAAAQIAGLAGASTIPLAGFLVLVILWRITGTRTGLASKDVGAP